MSYMDKHLNNVYGRLGQLENRLAAIYKVLEEIIGKELLRGQALHKVLMDKALFTDAELKTALEKIVEEAKADMKAMEEKVKEEKAKAIELLVPAGANLKPPVETPSVNQEGPTQEQLAALAAEQPAPKTEEANGQV